MHPNKSDWQPSAPLENLKKRATLLADIRHFFSNRSVLEVQTPILGSAPNPDPNLVHFVTSYTQPGGLAPRTLYLQTSPEFHMKRLLAAGSGSIYQLGPVFRNEEAGRFHNPEFYLLEWYRVDFDAEQLMDEVETLIQQSISCLPAKRIRYQNLFLEVIQFDPLDCTVADVSAKILACGIHLNSPIDSIEEGLQVLMTHVIEPSLKGLVFVTEFPIQQAMLAEAHPTDSRVALRFEVYFNGVELANGFQELRSETLQRERFNANNTDRLARGLAALELDEKLLAALSNMPMCSGVALGIDRLVQISCGGPLAESIAFAIDKV